MYSGPSLAALFEMDEPIHRLCEELARAGGRRMRDDIREFTPIGDRPFDEGYTPGSLWASISERILVVYVTVEGIVYESGAETNLLYAPYVEEGTGLWGPYRAKYEIRPKNPDGWLRFHNEVGDVVFAKRVMHPGSPGQHFFAKGAAKTEAEFALWAEPIVVRWAREQNAAMLARARARVMVS